MAVEQKTGKDKTATDKAPVAEESKGAVAKPRVGVLEFFGQVRQETSKVTWPTIAETRLTSIAVFILVTLAMIFFFAVDYLIGWIVQIVMNAV